jgi:photosystem II PsbY protein
MQAAACIAAPALKGCRSALPARAPRAQRAVVRAQAGRQDVQEAVAKSAALAGFSAALLSAGSANAAMEVASIAASDNRFGTIALLAVPVLGWVGFNILGPLQNQLNAMSDEKPAAKKATKKRSVAAGLGLAAASLLAAQQADAAQQVADLAASDNRFGTIALLAVPVLGWVGFNILGPLQNQLNAMSDDKPAPKKAAKKRGIAAGLGLTAASLMATQSAEAAQQVADLAASDNRFGTIALLAVPVLGWVGFNILNPLQNQLDTMSSGGYAGVASGGAKKATKKRGIAAGLGLTAASLMAAQSAEAAQQVADLAASDNRFGIIALLAVPVLGWVGFNILGPLQNQLNAMSGEKPAAKGGKRK